MKLPEGRQTKGFTQNRNGDPCLNEHFRNRTLQSTKPELALALKAGPSGDGKRRRFRGRNALVIAQVAGSLLLLICATQTYSLEVLCGTH
jgi:hypothetical protein